MAVSLQQWRKRHHLTQVDAATLLGVSQTYLSLIENGSRPLTATLRARLKPPDTRDDELASQLSRLGYPGFAHVKPARRKPRPDVFLLSVLAQPDVDARVVEALPWLVREYAGRFHFSWMIRQAKLQNLQNRLGFTLQMAGVETPALKSAIDELEQARLLKESTLCWDSMRDSTRKWIRLNRSPSAAHWNIVSTLVPEKDSRNAK